MTDLVLEGLQNKLPGSSTAPMKFIVTIPITLSSIARTNINKPTDGFRLDCFPVHRSHQRRCHRSLVLFYGRFERNYYCAGLARDFLFDCKNVQGARSVSPLLARTSRTRRYCWLRPVGPELLACICDVQVVVDVQGFDVQIVDVRPFFDVQAVVDGIVVDMTVVVVLVNVAFLVNIEIVVMTVVGIVVVDEILGYDFCQEK